MNTHDPREIITTPGTRPELDLTKPLGTPNGEKVRFIGSRNHPLYKYLFGIVDAEGNDSEVRGVTTTGQYYAGTLSPIDIINLE